MTRALNIFATDKPSRWSHGPIQPMSPEDEYFWNCGVNASKRSGPMVGRTAPM